MTDTGPGDIVQPLDHIQGLFDLYDEAKTREIEAGEQKRAIVEQIKKEMGQATIGTIGGRTRVTYREHTRTTIDSKALRADWPEIAEKCETVSTSRPFKVVDA